MSRVVLLALPEDLADQLSLVLDEESHQVTRQQSFPDDRPDPQPEVIFLSGDSPNFVYNIYLVRSTEPQVPVVVVTRMPDMDRWLDALEAGARDYCGAPFERVQIRWIMDTVCPRAGQRAA